MARILNELDREWATIATSLRSRMKLDRWKSAHPALADLADLDALLVARRDPARAQEILRAVAHLAPEDDLAARTLLQALIPGIVRLAQVTGNDDPSVIDELVAIAWERIRTYPTTRNGSVAANVLLDTRKRYRRHRAIESPADGLRISGDPRDQGREPEEEVLNRLLVEELDATRLAGVISPAVFRAIVRTRIGGERLAAVAADESLSPRKLGQQRWRAERRLRDLPLAG